MYDKADATRLWFWAGCCQGGRGGTQTFMNCYSINFQTEATGWYFYPKQLLCPGNEFLCEYAVWVVLQQTSPSQFPLRCHWLTPKALKLLKSADAVIWKLQLHMTGQETSIPSNVVVSAPNYLLSAQLSAQWPSSNDSASWGYRQCFGISNAANGQNSPRLPLSHKHTLLNIFFSLFHKNGVTVLRNISDNQMRKLRKLPDGRAALATTRQDVLILLFSIVYLVWPKAWLWQHTIWISL